MTDSPKNNDGPSIPNTDECDTETYTYPPLDHAAPRSHPSDALVDLMNTEWLAHF